MKIGAQTTADPKIRSWLIVVVGIIFFQALVYGPSLIGQKILLPLDLLSQRGVYTPRDPGAGTVYYADSYLNDLTCQFEPARRFAASEIHQGRFPLWSPFEYGGSPFVWPKYSPFLLLEYTTSSPVILAWVQLLAALVTGAGMYGFCRGVLKVSFWPAAVSAWLYPMTAFFMLWLGFPTRLPVCWLPWLFLLIDRIVRRPSCRSAAGLGLVTGLTLVSGNSDVGGQVLLGGGIFALWCLWEATRDALCRPKLVKVVALLAAGWGLGIMLALPHLLPLVEYIHTGARMMDRGHGTEERPPVGLDALPQMVLPDMYGENLRGWLEPRESNLLESSSAAYISVLATLLIAPLAWLSPARRRGNWFWLFLAFFGMSWELNVPGFVQLLRSPGLNMMSHNRLVFLTGFALFVLAVTGLENIIQGKMEKRRWFFGPMAILAVLIGWCVYRGLNPPQVGHSLDEMMQFEAWFSDRYLDMAALCGLAFTGWLLIWKVKVTPQSLATILVFLWSADLWWFDHNWCVQSDPALYYPPVPALTDVAQSPPGRVVGLLCLVPTLSVMAGLNDVRGYDAIDPARMIRLLHLAAESTHEPPYGRVQLLIPKWTLSPPDRIRFSPILDMMNVRYAITRGLPPDGYKPLFQSPDYCVFTNANALPRAFVPRTVEKLSDEEVFQKMAATNFNPAAVAYVSSPIDLPPDCEGQADITNEIPTDIKLSVQMKTPGMVVLSDCWNNGWHALWNGSPAPILQANYAIRGVVLPAGAGTLEFFYHPASLIRGLYLAAVAILILAGMALVPARSESKTD